VVEDLKTRVRAKKLKRLLGVAALAFGGGALGYLIVSGTWSFLFLIIIAAVSVGAVVLGAQGFGLVVLALCGLPLFSQTYHVPLMWAAVIVWTFIAISERVLRVRVRPAASLDSAARWLPLAFLTSALLADIFGSENQVQDVVSKTLTLAFGVLTYYLAASTYSEPAWHRRALVSLSAGALIVLAIGVLMMLRPGAAVPGMLSFSGSTLYRELGHASVRFTGPLGDYELAAEMLGISSIALFGVAAGTKGPRKILLSVLGAISLGGILLTGTRAGLIISAVGMALLMLKRQPSRSRNSFLFVVAVVGVAVALTLRFFPDASVVIDRFSRIKFGVGLSQTVNRGNLWPGFLDRISASAGIMFGHGAEYDYLSIGTYPHSLYLYVLYSQGLLGLAVLIAFLLRLLVPVFACLRERGAWNTFSLGPVLVALFVADQVKIEFTRVYSYQMWIWALLGLVAIGTRARTTAPTAPELPDA
jgi:hypothetical protein